MGRKSGDARRWPPEIHCGNHIGHRFRCTGDVLGEPDHCSKKSRWTRKRHVAAAVRNADKNHASHIFITVKDQRIAQDRCPWQTFRDMGSIGTEHVVEERHAAGARHLGPGENASHAMPDQHHATRKRIARLGRAEVPAKIHRGDSDRLSCGIEKRPELKMFPDKRIGLESVDDLAPHLRR